MKILTQPSYLHAKYEETASRLQEVIGPAQEIACNNPPQLFVFVCIKQNILNMLYIHT